MNKLRSSSIVRPDAREDGTSNLTKFLAACASYGLPPEDLFSNDDFAVSSAESLARVAKTIIALFQLVETPFLHRSKVLVGQSGGHMDNSPYSPGTFSRAAAASSPNLSSEHLRRSVSPAGPPSPVRQRRFSPPGLPPVRSRSPEEPAPRQNSPSKPVKRDGIVATALVVDVDNDRITANPIIPAVPPRSPRRPQPPFRQFDNDADDPFTRAVESAAGGLPERESVADSIQVLVPGSARASVADSSLPIPIPIVQRQSTASSMTETTSFTSLLDFRQQNNSGTSNNTNNGNFGTVRTMTTEATSAFSFGQAEDSPVSPSFFDEMIKKRRFSMERKISGTGSPDLVRVPEEVEEGSTYKAGGGLMAKGKAKAQDHEREKVERNPIHPGKGKRPDDFFTPQFQNHSPAKSRPPDQEDSPSRISNPLSSSPSRKLGIPGANRRSESLEVLPEFPRPSLHRPSHSIDTPGLLPKASVYARDASPDGLASASSRVMPRRNTKPNVPRNGICIPRLNIDNPRNSCGSGDSLVPFPRAVSGEQPSPSPSPSFDTRAGGEPSGIHDNPRPVRGRFQSDVEGSSTRRPRPSSYDELGARPARTRFESMVNLGVVTGNASASDLITRDSMDGSTVRKTLIVREQGKPPTHFVSSLFL